MLTLNSYVLKNLGRQKLRTVLAAFGVTLGIWLVVGFTAISDGAMNMVEAMLSEFGEDFHCYKQGVSDPFTSRFPSTETKERILAVDGVKEAASVVFWFSPVGKSTWGLLIGLDPADFACRSLAARATGSFSGPDAAEVLVGTRLMEQAQVAPGDTLTLEGHDLAVVGSFVTGRRILDSSVILPLKTTQDLFFLGADVANYFVVTVADRGERKAVTDRVEAAIPEVKTVSTLEELSEVDQGLNQMRMWSVLIVVMATGLGWLFIMLAMIMVVFERIREIGILRAVGWTKRKVVAGILLEACLLAFVGAVVGVPTGILGVEIIGRVTELGNYIAPSYEPVLYLRAVLVAMLAAAVGGVYPAWRAARLRPAEAIRHE
jgi:putative ABC transport system permease protein